MRRFSVPIVCVLLLVLTGCTEPTPTPKPPTAISLPPTVTPELTDTAIPTATPTVTDTPEPTATPTITLTPTPELSDADIEDLGLVYRSARGPWAGAELILNALEEGINPGGITLTIYKIAPDSARNALKDKNSWTAIAEPYAERALVLAELGYELLDSTEDFSEVKDALRQLQADCEDLREELEAIAPIEQLVPPTATPTSTLEPTKTPAISPTPKPISDLSPEQFGMTYNSKTSLQQKAYREELLGIRVRWTGEVLGVYEDGTVHISVKIGTMGKISDERLLFVNIIVPLDRAIELNEDQVIVFEGEFAEWDPVGFLTVDLENSRLVE